MTHTDFWKWSEHGEIWYEGAKEHQTEEYEVKLQNIFPEGPLVEGHTDLFKWPENGEIWYEDTSVHQIK